MISQSEFEYNNGFGKGKTHCNERSFTPRLGVFFIVENLVFSNGSENNVFVKVLVPPPQNCDLLISLPKALQLI